jgi:hypothetical protein
MKCKWKYVLLCEEYRLFRVVSCPGIWIACGQLVLRSNFNWWEDYS